MTRRQVVQGVGAVGLGLVAGCGPWPGQAPPASKLPRIAYLSPSTPDAAAPPTEAFRQGLRERHWEEGRNLLIDYRYSAGHPERLPDFATELVHIPVDIVVAVGNPAIRAARDVTSTIPIVMAPTGVDPVAAGLVASLARPAGNTTGVTQITAELTGKRLELLKETSSSVSRVAVLWNAAVPDKVVEFREVQRAAEMLAVQLVSLAVRGADEFDGAFETGARERADALLTLQDGLVNSHQPRIAALALQYGWPSMADRRELVASGGLMSYGPDIKYLAWRAAYYVDRILNGARPADLPIEQPREFEFVLNLRTAQALGLTVPPSVLLQATEALQ